MKLSRFVLTLFLIVMCSSRMQVTANQYYGNGCCTESCANECGAFKVYGDYLYWQVSQDQMQYAAVLPGGLGAILGAFSGESSAPVVLTDSLTVIDQTFNYNSGFRLGVGYDVACSNWDFDLSWTRLHQRVNTGVSDAGFGVMSIDFPAASIIGIINAANGGRTNVGGFANHASSIWKFEYDTVDFNIGRKLCLMNCAVVRPYIGVKLASVKQHQNIAYDGFSFNINDIPTPAIIQIQKKNSFRGVGPSFGIDGSWEFLPNFNLTSGISGSLLYGKFDVSQTPSIHIAANSITVGTNNNRKNRIAPTVDGNIGIDWETCLCDRFFVKVGVGYEVQYWWNQWQATSTVLGTLATGSNPHGDLMVQGLTVELAVGF